MQDKKFDIWILWPTALSSKFQFFPTSHLESVSEKNILVLILSLASWAHYTHKFGYEIFTSKTVFFALK